MNWSFGEGEPFYTASIGKTFTATAIAQLLHYTSGLPDYFEGETRDGSPNMLEMLFSDTSQHWNPVETLDFTMEKIKPHFEPGTGYQYSDTEYVLLSLIVESLNEIPLH